MTCGYHKTSGHTRRKVRGVTCVDDEPVPLQVDSAANEDNGYHNQHQYGAKKVPCTKVMRQTCAIRQRLSVIRQVCRPMAQPRTLLRFSTCALNHRAPGVDRTNQVGGRCYCIQSCSKVLLKRAAVPSCWHVQSRASCRNRIWRVHLQVAVPVTRPISHQSSLLFPSFIHNLMQQLLIQRPVLVLLPRTHTHVRPVFGSRSRQRSLVTSASWQSWFAGSPRKQVPTCSR